jgi:hypothetical protein
MAQSGSKRGEVSGRMGREQALQRGKTRHSRDLIDRQ